MSLATVLHLPTAPYLSSRDALRHNISSACPLIPYLHPKFLRLSLKPISVKSRYKKGTILCFSGVKEGPETGNEVFPWKSLEKAVSNLGKDQSIEDVLRNQIQKQEYYDDGGNNGGKRPDSGGGGGGGSNEPEDEGFSANVDEFVQVFLATISFIFLYMYFIEGEDIKALAKDLIRLLFTGQKSNRLKRLINDWENFIEDMKEEEDEPYLLERALLQTPTDYDGPHKYQWIIENKPEMFLELFEKPATVPSEQPVVTLQEDEQKN